MALATVPDWVIERSRGAAIAVYAALDAYGGKCSKARLAKNLRFAPNTVSDALRELHDIGALATIGRAHYRLIRDQPTELSTDLSTGSQQGDSRNHAASREFSTLEGTPTTTGLEQRQEQEQTSGGEGSDCERRGVGLLSAGSETPKLTLINGRNLGFDALSETCNADPRSRAGEITAALKKIRGWAWEEMRPLPGEAFEHALAALIHGKALLYRNRMSGATLTPTALAKWWFDLEKLPEQGLSPEQIASGEWA